MPEEDRRKSMMSASEMTPWRHVPLAMSRQVLYSWTLRPTTVLLAVLQANVPFV